MQAAGAVAHPLGLGWVAWACCARWAAWPWPGRPGAVGSHQYRRAVRPRRLRRQRSVPVPRSRYAFGLAGYTMFGVGYIGLHDLRDRAAARAGPVAGAHHRLLRAAGRGGDALLAPVGGLLDRHRDGRPLALLNGLLGWPR